MSGHSYKLVNCQKSSLLSKQREDVASMAGTLVLCLQADCTYTMNSADNGLPLALYPLTQSESHLELLTVVNSENSQALHVESETLLEASTSQSARATSIVTELNGRESIPLLENPIPPTMNMGEILNSVERINICGIKWERNKELK